MPTVTFLGPFYNRRRPDSPEEWIRGEPVQVTQAWLDQWRGIMIGDPNFKVEGDEGPHADEGADGVPDKSWNRKKILAWVEAYDIVPNGYATKSTLLDLVEKVMNPAQVEEVQDLVEETVEQEEEQESD